jgi:small subunit ribosomal protein S6
MMLILYPDISDENRQAFQTKLEDEVTSQGGHLTNLELWGKRTLAYEIKDRTDGYYILVHFDLPRKSIKAICTACSLDPRVLRQKVFRLDLARVAPTGGSE